MARKKTSDPKTEKSASRGSSRASAPPAEKGKSRKKSSPKSAASKSQPKARKTAPAAKKAKTQVVPEREPRTPWGRRAKARREQKAIREREREERRLNRQIARQKRRSRRRRLTARGVVFLGLMVTACLVGVVILALLGRPYPWESLRDVSDVLRYQREIGQRQARWESLSIHHYTVTIEYTDTADTWCGPGKVEVSDGQLIAAPSPGDTHWFPADTCDQLIGDLVFESAYGWLETRLRDFTPGETRVTVTFDQDFGYPTHAEVTTYQGEVEGCCWQVTWQDMTPLDE